MCLKYGWAVLSDTPAFTHMNTIFYSTEEPVIITFFFTHLPTKVDEITSLLLQKLVFSSYRDDIHRHLFAFWPHICTSNLPLVSWRLHVVTSLPQLWFTEASWALTEPSWSPHVGLSLSPSALSTVTRRLITLWAAHWDVQNHSLCFTPLRTPRAQSLP